MTTFKKGDIVLYSPIMMPGEPKFAAVVRESPWQLGDGTWVTHLIGLSDSYRDFIGCPGKTTVHAACFEALELAPTIHCDDGKWITQAVFEGDFLVGYVVLGQVYWHDGKSSLQESGWKYSVGMTHGLCAKSYEAAHAAVEELCK